MTARRRQHLWALLAALAICGSLTGCGAGALPQELRNAGGSSLNTLMRVLTPGLGIPCAGRRSERGFSQPQAKACLKRLSGDYVNGVRQGLKGR